MEPDYYMMDYHPYHQGTNSLHVGDSQTLVWFKGGTVYDEVRRKDFLGRVCVWFRGILGQVPDTETVVLTVAPGHSPASPPSFMHSIIGGFLTNQVHPNLVDGRSQLVRTIEVPKSAYTPGPRTEETHRQSIAVSGKGDIATLNSGRVVIILDDIWTSGCTLRVCREKILATGASRVIMLAIGKTVQYV